MPQTFTQLHYHIVFSTKHREPTIVPAVCERVWDYLGGLIQGEGGISHRVGGMPDHVHLLATLPQTRSVAAILREIKSNSSSWAHKNLPNERIWWQVGYGAFTVSHSAIPSVIDYIERQEEHHKNRTFQDEFRMLLKKHGLEPDEKYMWD
jgi:putative transposase